MGEYRGKEKVYFKSTWRVPKMMITTIIDQQIIVHVIIVNSFFSDAYTGIGIEGFGNFFHNSRIIRMIKTCLDPYMVIILPL